MKLLYYKIRVYLKMMKINWYRLTYNGFFRHLRICNLFSRISVNAWVEHEWDGEKNDRRK